MKSRLVIFFYAFVSLYVMCNINGYKQNQFRWDVSGYYLYLPAIFIYHDLATLSFYLDVNKKYQLSKDEDSYAIYNGQEGRKNNKYAIGTAVFELPFFLAAHAYCLAVSPQVADGYSMPYQLACYCSTVLFICLGLFFIRSLLHGYFSDGITAFALLCIAFGTNIYCYTIFQPGMSHPYSFFLFAGILYYTDSYYRTSRSRYMYYLGLLLGMVLITRSVNIVVAVIPLLWAVDSLASLKTRISLLITRKVELGLALVIMLAVSMIQMSYWKYSTGHWVYYSYVNEGFSFTHPNIIKGLFSYQKGWFLYTPIALVSLLGLFCTWRYNRKVVPVLLLFFFLMIYVVFSWKAWWYGGGFSARPMIESLPIAAVPLAYLLRVAYEKSGTILAKFIVSLALIAFIVLNVFQSYQYFAGVIHFSLMTKSYYWRVFGKTEVSDDDKKLLMTWEQYDQEIKDAEADHR